MSWDPEQYLTFADHRLRPAVELLARVPAAAPARVVDLGCGAGNVTALLRARWPDAQISGLDNSDSMLARARATGLDCEWENADIATWRPDYPVDLLFSNAALQWLGGHETLFPRLAESVAPGGWLAIQIPDNREETAHSLVVETALDGPWRPTLEPILRLAPILSAAGYYDMLMANAKSVDVWHTRYLQVLEGENPVVEFIKGSRLRPLLDALPEPERSAFETEYARRVAAAYPRQRNGKTLFPFLRLFMVAGF